MTWQQFINIVIVSVICAGIITYLYMKMLAKIAEFFTNKRNKTANKTTKCNPEIQAVNSLKKPYYRLKRRIIYPIRWVLKSLVGNRPVGQNTDKTNSQTKEEYTRKNLKHDAEKVFHDTPSERGRRHYR
jgi:hypothetical protein